MAVWEMGYLVGKEPSIRPTRLDDALKKRRVVMLAAGGHHSAAVTDDGVLWTWGEGAQGQLGHGDLEARRKPTAVVTGKRGGMSSWIRLGADTFKGSPVIMVACGSHHTLIVTSAGGVWSCGQSDFGQLGLGDTTSQLTFRQVDMEGAVVVMVAAGAMHSAAIAADGHVFTWGCV